MALKAPTTLKAYQHWVDAVYGVSNSRHFSSDDMLINIERYLMRSIKGIRKEDQEKILLNLLIASSWFLSLMNRLQILIEEEVWKRFPNCCSYCGEAPCACKIYKTKKRVSVTASGTPPKGIGEFQKMFARIYPPDRRTLQSAGIHLAEEMGELSEAMLVYRGTHSEKDFKNIVLEAADLFSCIMGVCNSISRDMQREIGKYTNNNCHACHKAPCTCSFERMTTYKS